MFRKFWIVLRDSAPTLVGKRHDALEDARQEAERLARKEGVPFFVLETIGRCESAKPPVPPVLWELPWLKGEASDDLRCDKCGGLTVELRTIPCPDNMPGCLVLHRAWLCSRCGHQVNKKEVGNGD